jgi:DNA-directed RNA polymerase specialized sigma24 family protein
MTKSSPARGGQSKTEKENQAYECLLNELGSYELARRINKLPSYKAYDQAYPFDSTTVALSLDELIEENLYIDAPGALTPEAQYMKAEDTENYLSDLPEPQRTIIAMTIEHYTPAEIAEALGQHNSNAVRQNKYKALRALQVPIKLEKRSNQKHGITE